MARSPKLTFLATDAQHQRARTRIEVLRSTHPVPSLVPEAEREILIKHYHQQHRRFLTHPELVSRYSGNDLTDAIAEWIAEKCILADVIIEDALQDLQKGVEEKVSPTGGIEQIKMDQAAKKQLTERIRIASEWKDSALGLSSKVSHVNSDVIVAHSVAGTMTMVPSGFNPPTAIAQLIEPKVLLPGALDAMEGEVDDE